MKEVGTHRNIVSMLGYWIQSPPIMLIMEYVPNGDLLHWLRNKRRQVSLLYSCLKKYLLSIRNRAAYVNAQHTRNKSQNGSVKTELYPRADYERELFLLTLRFCFSLALRLIFLFWVFNRISYLFLLVSTFRSFLEFPPPSRRASTFSGQNESRDYQWWSYSIV